MKRTNIVGILTVVFVLTLSLGAFAWNDGLYKGEAEGHNGPVILEVEVKDGLISSIEILEHKETPYLSDAGFEVRNVIIAQQSLEVDAISGATVTSTAVIAAVKNALNPTLADGKYTGEAEGFKGPIAVEVEIVEGKIAKITVLSHSETPYLSDVAFVNVPEAMIAGQTTEVDTVAGATGTSEGITAAVKDAIGEWVISDTDK